MELNINGGLLIVEREILESLNTGEKTLAQLEKDTGVEFGILSNIVSNLLLKNIIVYKTGKYSLNLLQKKDWVPVVNEKSNVQVEMKDLFNSIVDCKYSGKANLKMQKIFLTKYEEKILATHLGAIESFIKSVREDRKYKPVSSNTADQKIIFWGESTYKEVVNRSLEAV